jgi:hypothetical protein
MRGALDSLAGQSALDGGLVFPCVGLMKVTLINLENRLREMDRLAPEPPSAEAAVEPVARERLASATAELAPIRKGVA